MSRTRVQSRGSSFARRANLMALLCLIACAVNARAVTRLQTGFLTPAEAFVLKTVEAGKEADLQAFSSIASNRIIRHEFLEKLLTGGYGKMDSGRRSIRIRNAVVRDRTDVSNEDIPYVIWLSKCKFEGGVDFSGAHFARDLSLAASSFGPIPHRVRGIRRSDDEKTEPALFIGMQVDGSVTLTGATFYVPPDFTYARVMGPFLFDHVTLESTGYGDFEGLSTKEPAYFRNDRFKGPVTLTDAELVELFFEDNILENNTPDPMSATTFPDLDLTGAHIGREMLIHNVAFRSFEGRYLSVDGPATFDGITVSNHLALAHSHFQTLTIKQLQDLRHAPSLDVDLEGLYFEGVDVAESDVSNYASQLLDLINSDRCRHYSPQPYMQLESFLRAHGNPEEADETYIDMRRRERKQLSWWKRPWNWLLDVLIGYGRKPWKAALYSLAVTILGMLVFRRGRMRPITFGDEPDYSSFWYSLDLLAPVINLGPAKEWEPKPAPSWIRHYTYVQRIAGWILIPLVVAAITGIIK